MKKIIAKSSRKNAKILQKWKLRNKNANVAKNTEFFKQMQNCSEKIAQIHQKD